MGPNPEESYWMSNPTCFKKSGGIISKYNWIKKKIAENNKYDNIGYENPMPVFKCLITVRIYFAICDNCIK